MAKEIIPQPLKRSLRKKLKSVRNGIPSLARKTASKKIAKNLFKLPEFREAKTVGLYISKGSEVETLTILEKILALGKTAAAPKVTGNGRMEYRIINGLNDLAPGRFGIFEPKKTCKKISLSKIDLLLVPGIAFDRAGSRLGYGGGFFDRIVAKNRKIASAGLSYEKTFVKKLPRSSNDVPVKIVITEKRTVPIFV